MLLDDMIGFLRNYRFVGWTGLNNIPSEFLLQLNNIQTKLIDNRNAMIRKKIFFLDNFDKLSEDDWNTINKAIKNKIYEWLSDIPIKQNKTI